MTLEMAGKQVVSDVGKEGGRGGKGVVGVVASVLYVCVYVCMYVCMYIYVCIHVLQESAGVELVAGRARSKSARYQVVACV